ncbi:MAG: hypothetical protein GC192_17935 [Bacteroidetes bacterium]|nr:hypothetical protein [Bacteroidota bacterium]
MKNDPQLHFFQIKTTPKGAPRTVRLLLPKDYHQSSRRYPVIYALDGQNLFDPKTAFGGRHWKIPETMMKLPKKLQAIVVGIDNAGVGRINEYAPFKRGRQGGGGAAHLRFIMQELKPELDANYRTLPQREATAIVGSSMGGLLALYAGFQFGEVFGKVGAMSPSLWFNPQLFNLAEKEIDPRLKIYVAGSKTESRGMEPALQRLYWLLRNGGVSEGQLRVVIRGRGKHNEVFWRSEYAKLHRWLLEN